MFLVDKFCAIKYSNMNLIIILLSLIVIVQCDEEYRIVEQKNDPTILIVTLIRNKAHILPYFFSYLENLNYPKDRISLWFRADHNLDNSVYITRTWLERVQSSYHSVDFHYDDKPTKHRNESSMYDWPEARFSHIIKLKGEGLEKARSIWADYVFFLDADVILTNPDSLRELASYDLPIVAPMLFSEDLYSNFWCGMSENYYYQRTDEYKEIYRGDKNGNFQVPMVHTAVLVNLNYKNSDVLTFDRSKLISNQKISNFMEKLYNGPMDDIIIFAISAKSSAMDMYVSNKISYGYLLQPMEKDDTHDREMQMLTNIKIFIINDLNEVPLVNEELKKFVTYPERQKISFDQIYMINLVRRPERRHKMELSFKEIGLDVEYVSAVDGQKLNLSVIADMGIKFLPGYEDPYHHRQMTMGEIGCFLSHYKVWKKMVDSGQNEILVLEDDIRFEPYFIDKALSVMNEVRKTGEWDLVYFGRKRLEDQDEPWVENTDNLVHVGYSYWTLGYVLSLNGAKKLLDINPLENLLPVDEFLPIMFDRHPNDTWRNAFEPRNLIAYSAAPLLLYPTRYTGEEGYVSDTEDSEITPVELIKNPKTSQSDQSTIPNDIFNSNIDNKAENSKHTAEIFSSPWSKVSDEL